MSVKIDLSLEQVLFTDVEGGLGLDFEDIGFNPVHYGIFLKALGKNSHRAF